MQISQIKQKVLENANIRLSISPEKIEQLCEDGYDPAYGARPIKRLLQREIVDRLAKDMLSGKVVPGMEYVLC